MKKKSLLITAIAILGFAIVSMAQTVPSYVPTSGLVGWWPFTGNANDSSGNGNNCTTFNSPILSSDRYGNANASYFFDGIDDWIETNAFFLKGDSTHSISMWFKSTDSTKNNQTLFNTSPHTMENFAYHYNSSGTPPYGLSFGIGDGAGSWSIQHPDLGQIITPPTLGQWHHVVWTKDVLLNWRFYMDKILLATFNSVTNTGNTLANLRFGAENAGFPTGGANFLGYLDDIGVWNRALDSCEVKDLYAASLGNCCHISISTQPLSQSVSISNNVQFTTSSDSSATYQWQSDLGVGFQNINSVGQYSGTTNDTLSVSSVTMSNNNQPFRCIIRSGSCYDTSDIAILNVCGAVTISPANQNVVINNTAQFTTASTDPMATYQWQSDLGVGFQNINSVGQYSGTNKDTLRVANVTMGNNNQPFRCIVSSGACSDTSNAAVLTVINANGINETSANNLFTVYPNPAKSQINVKADASLIGSSYTVYNNIGKATLTGKINAENTVLDLGHLSSGVYLFSIGDSLKQKFTVVKE